MGWSGDSSAPGSNSVRLKSVRVVNSDRTILPHNVDLCDVIGIEIEYTVLKAGAVFVPSIHVHNGEGILIFVSIDLEENWVRAPRKCGTYISVAWIPKNFLNTGPHYVSVACSRLNPHELHFFEQQVVAFNAVEGGAIDTARGDFTGALPGTTRPILQWSTETI
jgi:lipopolysaccharide transport system ATP-binding protein